MPSQKTCTICGARYPESEFFCPRDGSALRVIRADLNNIVGQVIADRYLVIRQVGEGGMGQVYLAEHVRMGRRIALKVLKPNMVAEPDALSRFNREASNASKISHPNVAAVYDFGETVDGLTFLAMEFVEGKSLTNVLSGDHLPSLDRVANIVTQVANALKAAHDLGIVHRDLKPDNVMIGQAPDGSVLVKVVDFGIAKAAGGELQNVTRTGLVVGTPDYMSPEQLVGQAADARTDVYALGLVTFILLTGKLPFEGAGASEGMMLRLVKRPLSLTEARPGTSWPRGLQDVMDRVLAREVDARYQSAPEFAKALSERIESSPLGTRPGVELTRRRSIAQYLSLKSNAVKRRTRQSGASNPVGRRSGSRLAFGMIAVAVLGLAGALNWYRRHAAASPVKEGVDTSTDRVAEAVSPNNASPRAADTTKRANSTPTDKTDHRSGSVAAASDANYSFAPARLLIQISSSSPVVSRAAESAASRVSGASLVAEADRADLRLEADNSGHVILRDADGTAIANVDTTSAVRLLTGLFRQRMAEMMLATLDTAAKGPPIELGLGGRTPVFSVQDVVNVTVQSPNAGYLTLVDIDPSGTVTVVHPSADLNVGALAPQKQARLNFTAAPPIGTTALRAIVTRKPLDLQRQGPYTFAADGPELAGKIRHAMERLIRSGDSTWSTVAVRYTIK